ncbi:MAG TPA: alginate export family protein [Bacteroidales bacterium]
MTKISTKLLLFLLLTSTSVPKLFSQTIVDGEFRPRTEFREGFRKPLADTLVPAFVTLQRTRFNADYKSKILNARISLQDARIWGNSDNKVNSSKVEIYEAWFEYLIASGLSLQMGRQPLKYDDQRLLAAPAWSNTGMAHDVAVLKYKTPFMQIHSGFAYNNTKDTLLDVTYGYTAKQNYKTMSYAWLLKELCRGTSLSLIGIYEGFEKKTDYRIVSPRLTYGGNLVYANDSSAWGATLTGYLQSGKDPGKAYGKGFAKLNAYFLAAKVSYKFTSKLYSFLGLDYYSGSATDLTTSKSNTFNRLYGSTHSFNGSMEYYVTLPTQGLRDYYLGITDKVTPKFTTDLAGHIFTFDKDFIYNKVKAEKNLGSELDLTLSYTVSKEISIQGGYSMYFNSSSTQKYFKMFNVESYPQQWAFIMFTIKPQFYKTPVENK